MLRLRKCFCSSLQSINEEITIYGIPADCISLNSDKTTFYGIPGAIFFQENCLHFRLTFCFRILTARLYKGGGLRDIFSFFSKWSKFPCTPFFEFQFFKIVLRTYLQIFRPIRPTVFEKIDIFCQKMAILKNAFFGQNLHSAILEPCGFYQRIQRPLF